jgi:sugar phosphate isomerase/epimerase
MFKNLIPQAIGVSGRQSELIEMALTYGFKGFDLDMREYMRKVNSRGRDVANRYIQSAQIRLGFRVSGFELPVRWTDDENLFKQDLDKLPQLAEVAASLGARGCYTQVPAASDKLSYQDNFNLHRQRLGPVADVLGRQNIQLGLMLNAIPKARKDKKHEFVHQVDPFLAFLGKLGIDNIGIVLDLWHWVIGGGTIKQIRELSPGQIVQVRVCDAPTDADPAKITDEQRLLPGKGGLIDAVTAMRILGEMEYDGPVSPVANSKTLTGMTRDRIVRIAGEALDAVWKEAGLNRRGRLAPEEEEPELVGAAVGAEDEELEVPAEGEEEPG